VTVEHLIWSLTCH